MARVGAFQGPADGYGLPQAVILPPDNSYARAMFDPALLDPRLHLTDKLKRDVQSEIDALFSLLKIAQGIT